MRWLAVPGLAALASVVGGLVDRPVIAVPTSAGYGVSLAGVTPLLAMMTSCAPNVSVVNVDNGFGAGYVAALINRVDTEPGTGGGGGEADAGHGGTVP